MLEIIMFNFRTISSPENSYLYQDDKYLMVCALTAKSFTVIAIISFSGHYGCLQVWRKRRGLWVLQKTMQKGQDLWLNFHVNNTFLHTNNPTVEESLLLLNYSHFYILPGMVSTKYLLIVVSKTNSTQILCIYSVNTLYYYLNIYNFQGINKSASQL